MVPRARSVLAAALAAVVLSIPASAQDARGAILGRVVDPSGAVVAGADIRATNTATRVVVAAKTNEAGNYALPYLLPGFYTVEAVMAGFKKTVRENVQVRVGDNVELTLELQIGDTAEAIEVRAETPLLSTAEASLGHVVDERRIQELPSHGGAPYSLSLLAPGTVNSQDLRRRNTGAPAAISRFSADGAGINQNEFSIDGIPNTADGQAALIPPQEAVAEFRVQSATYDAAQGNGAGSVVNVGIKSGGNILHGEAHWFTQNRVFDAKTIIQNRSGQEIAAYTYQRYGASLGGPIRLPRVYDGTNRTFFFFAWEENPYANPVDYINTVPTAAMRSGDFSSLLAIRSTYQLYDPATTVRSGTQFTRQPFPGNIIPTSRLDPLGRNLLKFWPEPNQPGTIDFRQNYTLSRSNKFDSASYIFRFDHTFSPNHRIFVRPMFDSWSSDVNRLFGDNATGTTNGRHNKSLSFDDVVVLSPTLMLNVRYGFNYLDNATRRVTSGVDLAALGFSKNLISQLPDPQNAPLPNLQVGHLTAISTWAGTVGDGKTAWLTHSFGTNVTKMKGNHSIRFGGEFRNYREFYNRQPLGAAPQIVFNSTYTRGPNSTSAAPTLGGELASMLLGIPGGSMMRYASYAINENRMGLYVQDDFRVTRRLTVNLGLRYELERPVTERFDRTVAQFAFDTPSPIEAEARARYALNPIPELPVSQFRALGGLTFAATHGAGRSFWKGETDNIMPRVGFGYQLFKNTVLRGGYGVYYETIGVNANSPIQTGYSQSTPIQASLDNGLTYSATTANPFPGGLVEPLGARGGLATNLGQAVSFFPASGVHPYQQKWSFGFQQALPDQYVVGVSYVGSRMTRIGVSRELDIVPAQYLSRSPVRDQQTISFLGASFPSPFAGLNQVYTQNMSRAALLSTYPHFTGVSVAEPIGYSWYHSMQVTLERRFARSYTYQLSYTWSKAMVANDFRNESDLVPYEEISSLDRPHVIAMSGIWELPFGRKQRWGGNWPRVVDAVAGGWRLNAVMRRQSGPPLAWGDVWTLFTGNPEDVKLPNSQRSIDRWFNTAAGFNRASDQQLASNIRVSPRRFGNLRAAGQDRWDLSVVKNFRLTERFSMELRAEAINALNQVNLELPNMTPTSSAFGTISGQNPPRTWYMSAKVKF